MTVAIEDNNVVETTRNLTIILERPEDLDDRITIGYGRGEIAIVDDIHDGVCVCVLCMRVCKCVKGVLCVSTPYYRGCGWF